MPNTGAEPPLVEQLERRIDELEQMDEAEFGTFAWYDWLILIAGAVVAPIVVLIAAQ